MAADGIKKYQGPWWHEDDLARHEQLSKTELAALRVNHDLLALRFGDGDYYYPARQFSLRYGKLTVVQGLKDILDVLADAFEAHVYPAWLATEFQPNMSMWDALHVGKTEAVLDLARLDVNRWGHP